MRRSGRLIAFIALVIGTTALPAHADVITENCRDNHEPFVCIHVTDAKITRFYATLTVDGDGFTPNSQVLLRQDGDVPGGWILSHHQTEKTVTAGADGTFHTTMRVSLVFHDQCTGACAGNLASRTRWVNCAVNSCALFAYGDLNDVGVDLSFIWQP